MLSQLSKHLLLEGLEDWVSFGALSAPFVGLDPDPDEFLRSAREALEPLLRDGLMVMGDLSKSGGFRRWDLSPTDCLDRCEAIYRSDPNKASGQWVLQVWLDLTPAGRALAEQLEAQG